MLSRVVVGVFSVVLMVLALAGCTSGVAEYQLYTQSFELQFAEGTTVLDRLSRAERTVVRDIIRHESGSSSFKPDQAAYYVNAGDPPVTASIRKSLEALRAYNQALAALANGEAAAALSQRVGTTASNLVSAFSSLGGAGLLRGTALTGGPAFEAAATGAISRTLSFLKPLVGIAAREGFRKQLIAAYPDMRDLMLALRNATPLMFDLIAQSYVQVGDLDNPGGISASNRALLEQDKQQLAAWVILMDKSLLAMEAATVAAMRGASVNDLAELMDASVELKVLAAQLKVAVSGQ